MTGIFKAESGTNPILAREIAALNPANPFYTSQYIDFRRSQGFTPLILTNDDNAGAGIRCPAFMKTGRMRRSLEIPSMPNLPIDDPFWDGLKGFCRQQGVSDLSINSFGSQGGVIPTLSGETGRTARWEYVLNLKHSDVLKKMSKGHAYRIKRARKTGVEIQRVRDRKAVEAHARLISASMHRRKERGENVTTSVTVENLYHLVESGAAEIFQATLAGQVVSSNIILLAEKSGYSHTQGTSPEGMDCGAAHLLIHEIACVLRDEGKEVFNLGGTNDPDPESGLVKFKTGFGAATERIELEAARFMPGDTVSCLLRRLFHFGKEQV
ncbi:MAG: GNAT family N-acetyltransferase [Nitrosospira sp.]